MQGPPPTSQGPSNLRESGLDSGPVGPNGEGCAGPSKWRHGEPRLRADDLGISRPRAPGPGADYEAR